MMDFFSALSFSTMIEWKGAMGAIFAEKSISNLEVE